MFGIARLVRSPSRTARIGFPRDHMAVWRRLLLALTLLAFGLQSYVTQTHIHFEPRIAALFDGGAKAASAGKHQDRDRYPANEDPANCPLCQEMLYAGHYVAPTAIALWLPTLSISTIAIVVRAPSHFDAVSHIWHGRAPPLA